MSDIADYLLLRHHSVVELIDRAHAAGLVVRTRDKGDRRLVRLTLTKIGATIRQRLLGDDGRPDC